MLHLIWSNKNIPFIQVYSSNGCMVGVPVDLHQCKSRRYFDGHYGDYAKCASRVMCEALPATPKGLRRPDVNFLVLLSRSSIRPTRTIWQTKLIFSLFRSSLPRSWRGTHKHKRESKTACTIMYSNSPYYLSSNLLVEQLSRKAMTDAWNGSVLVSSPGEG